MTATSRRIRVRANRLLDTLLRLPDRNVMRKISRVDRFDRDRILSTILPVTVPTDQTLAATFEIIQRVRDKLRRL